jgi:hypothetical protein
LIRHAWSVLSQLTSVDGETNRVSMAVAESLRTHIPEQDLPLREIATIVITVELVTLWWTTDENENDEQEYRVAIRFGGESLSTTPVPFRLGDHRRFRSRVRFDWLPIRDSGTYVFAVEVKRGEAWDLVAEVPLDITIVLIPAPVPAH